MRWPAVFLVVLSGCGVLPRAGDGGTRSDGGSQDAGPATCRTGGACLCRHGAECRDGLGCVTSANLPGFLELCSCTDARLVCDFVRVPDAGASDAGLADAGVFDAGVDAGPPPNGPCVPRAFCNGLPPTTCDAVASAPSCRKRCACSVVNAKGDRKWGCVEECGPLGVCGSSPPFNGPNGAMPPCAVGDACYYDFPNGGAEVCNCMASFVDGGNLWLCF